MSSGTDGSSEPCAMRAQLTPYLKLNLLDPYGFGLSMGVLLNAFFRFFGLYLQRRAEYRITTSAAKAREELAKEGLPTPEIGEEYLKEVWSKYSSPADYLLWDLGRTGRTLQTLSSSSLTQPISSGTTNQLSGESTDLLPTDPSYSGKRSR